MNPQSLISVLNVSRIYRMGEISISALRNATIDIAPGEFLIILGPSGSGKSTLLHLIGGMDRPTSGSIMFMNKNLARASDRELTEYRRREVGFIFQFYNLVPTLTALENVQVAVELADSSMDPMDALRMVRLEHRAGHFPAQLSGGEQQRVSIARALAGDPRLILCDEPTGALDLQTSRHILRILMDLCVNLGKTVCLITHNAAIAGIGRRVAHIRDGAIHSLDNNSSPTPVEDVSW
ncbi:MAG TPA: ABC transporter ATP-binding protein [Candidatus Sumerlaeota bacterium]|nr:ABC transporter ATP-binding protein [Candidatus Sumerlaeota bacterium]